MSRTLKLGLLGLGGLLLVGLLALIFIPTPAEKKSPQANISVSSTKDTTTQSSDGSALAKITNNIPEFTALPSDTTGVIEGTFTHLGRNTIPAGTKVCAVNQTTFQETCTTELMKSEYYLYGTGYRVAVPPGEYTVYAQTPGDDYRAYYTPFVECGHREECQSHTPNKVVVTAGVVIENINPDDWSESENYK